MIKRPMKQTLNSRNGTTTLQQDHSQVNKRELPKNETNACIILKRLKDPLTHPSNLMNSEFHIYFLILVLPSGVG